MVPYPLWRMMGNAIQTPPINMNISIFDTLRGDIVWKEKQLIEIKKKYTPEELDWAYRSSRGWGIKPEQEEKAAEILEQCCWDVIGALKSRTVAEYLECYFYYLNHNCNCYNECHPCDCDEWEDDEEEESEQAQILGV